MDYPNVDPSDFTGIIIYQTYDSALKWGCHLHLFLDFSLSRGEIHILVRCEQVGIHRLDVPSNTY